MEAVGILEAKRAPITKRELVLRKEKRYSAFFIYAALYTGAQGLLLPLMLQFRSLNAYPYADLDPFSLLAMAAIFLMVFYPNKKKLRTVILLTICFYALYELGIIYFGRYQGWFLVGKLLSSSALGFTAWGHVSTMERAKTSSFKGSLEWPWALLLSLSLISSFEFYRTWEKKAPLPPNRVLAP